MKLVVIESPLAGDFARNQRYARLCCIDCLRRGESPYASHLFFTQFLDDRCVPERRLGIEAGFAWADKAELVALYWDLGISPGMMRARERWLSMHIPVEPRNLTHDLISLLDTNDRLTATPGAIV